MTIAWWNCLRHLDVEKAIQQYDAAVPEKAMFILGGSLTCEELLSLPGGWEGNYNFWGVYIDILSGKTICGMIPYVGSGAEKNQGLVKRLG